MSDFKHKEKEGSLFQNAYKTKDLQPDYTGKLVFGGIEYEIAGWKNKTKDGDPYTKVKLSEPMPKKKPDNKSYKSVGQSIPSKHLKDYQDKQKIVKEALEDVPIISDDDIPF